MTSNSAVESHTGAWGQKEKSELLVQSRLTLRSHETAAHQDPLFLEFSKQEHWSGLPFPSPMHARMLSRFFSRVQLCATPWRAAQQAPLSMGFSRQEYWSGLPFPSPLLILLLCKILVFCSSWIFWKNVICLDFWILEHHPKLCAGGRMPHSS